ncbi:conserved hypothetical protein [Hyella patelloides LEGE 07179]|uniref:HTH cro/C1-type domain-containing protein n=1 Tax=Hyella patelloides LEGE 07179 TaxID=945734 RepID=A0A563W5F3_9CYAN|nr:helix-turn-helix transcriptional regulator [Hyella patelloides]VEP18931.1 conserved hypothetical protein [Hyella patelloides LEGE 07179]
MWNEFIIDMGTCLSFAQWLLWKRKSRKLSQGKIALALEVDRSTISNWENEVSIPKLDPLQTFTLCEMLDVELSELAKAFKGEFEVK